MDNCEMKDNRPLVSVLTPCFNMEDYIFRLLKSILDQDYPCIEMFVIDDESTDGSIGVVESFIEAFNEKKYSLSVIRQKHGGQSTAIKNGLKHISGKYLVWPDADDFYADKRAVSEMVQTLEHANSDIKMVRTQERLLLDPSLEELSINGLHAQEDDPGTLFEDCLYGKNGYYACPGAYMLDIKALFEETGFDIYTDSYAGQNWQLMLPILYKYQCKTILKPYYNVLCRKSSHSRGYKKDYEETELRLNSYYLTLVNTVNKIKDMPDQKKELYVSNLKQNYLRKQLRAAVKYGKENKVESFYNQLKAIGGKTYISEDVVYFFTKLRLLHPLCYIYKRIVK